MIVMVLKESEKQSPAVPPEALLLMGTNGICVGQVGSICGVCKVPIEAPTS